MYVTCACMCMSNLYMTNSSNPLLSFNMDHYMDSNTVKKDEEIEKISTTSGDVVFELKKGFFTTQ